MGKYDIYWIDFAYAEKDGSKRRPAIQMSDDSKSTVILYKITSQHREQSRECPITLWKEANLTKPSNIRLDERLEIDKSNLVSSSKIGHLLKFDITQLNKKLNESIYFLWRKHDMKLRINENSNFITNENWCDDKLDQLYAKGKANWDQDDWETYAYCKNANAERDYYDSLDEDIEDSRLESAALTEFTNIVFDTLLQNTQYPQLDLDKLNEFNDEIEDFAQVDAERGKIDIGYDGHIYEISIKELK